MFEVNYLAVLGATVASFILGYLWYGPVFGKAWMAMMGFTPDSMKSMKLSPAKAMTMGFIVTLIAAYVISYFTSVLSINGASEIWAFTFWSWLGFMMPITAGGFLWGNRSFKLSLFNAAYQLANLFVIALVLGY